MPEENSLLFQPIKIGNMQLKNRLVMPPMNTNLTNENGAASPKVSAYYVRRAKGGVGLIVMESSSIVEDPRDHKSQPMLGDMRYVPGWADVIEKIHRYGTKVSVELNHYGSEGHWGTKMSSSDVSRFPGIPVHPLTREEIIQIEDQFALSAKNAKDAGFDAVTLHGAHGYLIAQFLSPLYNKRTDAYGGSLENRTRFAMEVIQKCHDVCGDDFPVMIRISANEYVEGGNGIEEAKEIAKLLESAGADAIDISVGVPAAYLFTIPPYSLPYKGLFTPFAKAVREVVKIPVICAGGIRNSHFAEEILQNGTADLVAIGRTLYADPDFCQKVRKGRDEDVRPCLSCQFCVDRLNTDNAVHCAINPEMGREEEFGPIRKEEHDERIAVIGGGPAGMEAARVLALRGFEVSLYEQNDYLGGTMNEAALPPKKEKITELIKWYEKQLSSAGVNVVLNRKVASTKEVDADIVLVAAGASYMRRIAGSNNKNVITAVEALKDPNSLSGKIAIIGGGSTGCEVAEFLCDERVKLNIKGFADFAGNLVYDTYVDDSKNGKDISIIEMRSDICLDMDEQNRKVMIPVLEENGVKSYVQSKVLEINASGVLIENIITKATHLIPADTVILAAGLLSNRLDETENENVIFLGDSSRPGRIADAIYEAYYVARELEV